MAGSGRAAPYGYVEGYVIDAHGARSNPASLVMSLPPQPANGYHEKIGMVYLAATDARFGENRNFIDHSLHVYNPKTGPGSDPMFATLQPTHVRIMSAFMKKMLFPRSHAGADNLLDPEQSPHRVEGAHVIYVDWAYQDLRGQDWRDYPTAKNAWQKDGVDYSRVEDSVMYIHFSLDGGLSWSRQIGYFYTLNEIRKYFRKHQLDGLEESLIAMAPFFDDDVGPASTRNNIFAVIYDYEVLHDDVKDASLHEFL